MRAGSYSRLVRAQRFLRDALTELGTVSGGRDDRGIRMQALAARSLTESAMRATEAAMLLTREELHAVPRVELPVLIEWTDRPLPFNSGDGAA